MLFFQFLNLYAILSEFSFNFRKKNLGARLCVADVQSTAPDFKGTAVVQKDFKTIQLSDYKGKYLVLFFYPLDLFVYFVVYYLHEFNGTLWYDVTSAMHFCFQYFRMSDGNCSFQ